MNRKLLVFLGLVTALVVLAGAAKTASSAGAASTRRPPNPRPPSPSSRTASPDKLDAENKAKAQTKPYEEAQYTAGSPSSAAAWPSGW